MNTSELIDALKEYPSDTRVMLYDEKNDFYFDPELRILDVIAVTEWSSERVCNTSRKWEYEGCKEFKILTMQ